MLTRPAVVRRRRRKPPERWRRARRGKQRRLFRLSSLASAPGAALATTSATGNLNQIDFKEFSSSTRFQIAMDATVACEGPPPVSFRSRLFGPHNRASRAHVNSVLPFTVTAFLFSCCHSPFSFYRIIAAYAFSTRPRYSTNHETEKKRDTSVKNFTMTKIVA